MKGYYENEELIELRKKQFMTWMLNTKGINLSVAYDYISLLDSEEFRYNLAILGMKESVFLYTDLDDAWLFYDLSIERYEKKVSDDSVFQRKIRPALRLYFNWMMGNHDSNGIKNKYGALSYMYHKLEEEYKQLKYDYEILRENPPKLDIDHEKQIADVFCKIAKKYMESTKNKPENVRTSIKNLLHDIISELEMANIPKDLLKCINHFDDQKVSKVPSYFVNGDLVLEKNVSDDKSITDK